MRTPAKGGSLLRHRHISWAMQVPRSPAVRVPSCRGGMVKSLGVLSNSSLAPLASCLGHSGRTDSAKSHAAIISSRILG